MHILSDLIKVGFELDFSISSTWLTYFFQVNLLQEDRLDFRTSQTWNKSIIPELKILFRNNELFISEIEKPITIIINFHVHLSIKRLKS